MLLWLVEAHCGLLGCVVLIRSSLPRRRRFVVYVRGGSDMCVPFLTGLWFLRKKVDTTLRFGLF